MQVLFERNEREISGLASENCHAFRLFQLYEQKDVTG